MGARRAPRGNPPGRVLRPVLVLLELLIAENAILWAGAAQPPLALPHQEPPITHGAALTITIPAPASAPGRSEPTLFIRASDGGRESDASFLFGSYVEARGGESLQQAITRMEVKAGRRFGIDRVYHGWQNPLIGPYERWSIRHGHALLISWKAALEWSNGRSNGQGAGYVRWADIAAGRYDRLIAQRAQELRRLGTPVYLTFHHEPENDADRSWERRSGTPAEFVAAWRHIWSVFRARKATNVKFVFILMGWSFRNGNAEDFYPGSRYVDVIGSDAYNWYGTDHPGSNHWTEFASAFGAAYHFAEAKDRSFWVTETGVMEDPGDPARKGKWLRSIASQMERWPNLRAVIYFMGGRYGWWADSSPRSLSAFRALARLAMPSPGP